MKMADEDEAAEGDEAAEDEAAEGDEANVRKWSTREFLVVW